MTIKTRTNKVVISTLYLKLKMNKTKSLKTIIIILVNLIIACLLLLLISFCLTKIRTDKPLPSGYSIRETNCKIYNPKIFINLKPNSVCYANILKNGKIIRKVSGHINSNGFRITPDNYSNTNKKRIAVFGCSYVYGYGLNDNETFPWLLSKYTHRKVYNLGIVASGAQQMLINLQSDAFNKKLQNVDIFIYVYMHDHLRRIYGPPFRPYRAYYPIFKLKNNKLKYIPPSPLYKAGIATSGLLNYIAFKNWESANFHSKETMDLFLALVKESQMTIKKLYPNAKFIIFDISDDLPVDNNLKSNGIIVITLKDIFNEKDIQTKYMYLEGHPTADFWQKITPLFVKKLNL